MTGRPFHVLVFFTYGNSLETWVRTGLLDRELLIYKKMVDQGHTVTLFTYGDQNDEAYAPALDGIHVIPAYKYIHKSGNQWVNLIRSFLIPFSRKLKKIFRSAHVYKTNQMFGAWIPLILSVLYQKPLVVRCGYEMLGNMVRNSAGGIEKTVKIILGYSLELMAYAGADRIMISNTSDIKFIHRFFPVNPGKMHLIRNFVDTAVFHPGDKKAKAKLQHSILYVGRIEPVKNIEALIQAVKKTGFHLDIIGNGSLWQTYKKMVCDFKNIRFIGTIPNRNLPSLIRKYRLFVLVSFSECNPKALLEAMACGRVVMGSNVKGIRELITDGKTGFLCETDKHSIRETIKRIFATPDNDLKIISNNARQFIIDECSLNKIAQKEMALYRELIP